MTNILTGDNILGDRAWGGGSHLAPGDKRVLGWIKEVIEEGEAVNRADPAYPKMDEAMDYVLGNQLGKSRPSYLPSVVINQTKKAIKTHVSALTDVRPLFAFKTENPAFQLHGSILNKFIVAWWVNTFADVALADAVKYSLVSGSGDLVVEYDKKFLGGNTRLVARDPRDTLPFRPSRSRSIQDWQGVILREAHSPNALRTMYPDLKDDMSKESTSKWGQVFTRFMKRVQLTTPVSTLDGLQAPHQTTAKDPNREIVLFRMFLKDAAVNMNEKSVVLGNPGTNWCYEVQPGKPLYPRGRCIVSTERTVLFDGPNPYWHGLFPITRLQLDPWPWTFFGLGLVNDTRPLQDAINSAVNDILTNFSQHVNRGLISDKNAVPEGTFKRFDPRRPNWKLKTNPTMGEGTKLADVAQLPAYAMTFLESLFSKFDEMTETANLQQLQQLKQMPSADTIEKYSQALTPGLRTEARMMEVALREVAEMVKVNIFQFESAAKRVTVLGDAGRTLSDFDYDPNTLVPALKEGQPGYVPELDADKTDRPQRAEFFHKLFTFFVAPNSMLALHSQDEQMKYVQLSRQGMLDFWTLMEMLEVPNAGSPPPIPLPPLDWKPEKDPTTGAPQPPPMEIRTPLTITERLMAMQQLGFGQTVSPAGRKASGQQPPQMQEGAEGAPKISESG